MGHWEVGIVQAWYTRHKGGLSRICNCHGVAQSKLGASLGASLLKSTMHEAILAVAVNVPMVTCPSPRVSLHIDCAGAPAVNRLTIDSSHSGVRVCVTTLKLCRRVGRVTHACTRKLVLPEVLPQQVLLQAQVGHAGDENTDQHGDEVSGCAQHLWWALMGQL